MKDRETTPPRDETAGAIQQFFAELLIAAAKELLAEREAREKGES